MSKKTLEKVKEHFKNTKTVKCLLNRKIFYIDTKTIHKSNSGYWCYSVSDINKRCNVLLFDKKTNELAEIIEYKDDIKELKEDLRLLLIAYELCCLTDFINKKDEVDYISENPTLNKRDLKVIFEKYEGWGFSYIDTEIRSKTEKLINII